MNKYKIVIKEPCSENWNKMSKTEKGAFCSKCNKEVINFKGKPTKQILKTIKESSKSVCGKIESYKLNTEYIIKPTKQKALIIFSISLLFSFQFLFTSCEGRDTLGEIQGKIAVEKPLNTAIIEDDIVNDTAIETVIDSTDKN
jgi:hypothetical protein